MTRISIVGSWHLSSVMATCFADKGHTVIGVDSDKDAIEQLSGGIPTIYEPKMEAILKRNLKAGRLSFTTDFGKALANPIVFLAIDTPIKSDGIDLKPIKKAVKKIAEAAKKKYILVVSSQVPVGTCEKLQALANKTNPKAKCEVVCNPEFLRLGGAIDLFLKSDRIILGADSPKAAERIAQVYEPFKSPVLTMSLKEAEMVKHATNAYVANQVSFIGEISQLCDEVGADALPVSKALKLDKRIGKYAYVRPGLGFNGGTVARDVKLLVAMTQKRKRRAPLLQAVLDVNARQNGLIAGRLKKALGTLKKKNVALLGLTYKAKTSTLRHSLTLQIAQQIRGQGAVLRAYDPMITPDEFDESLKIEICTDAMSAVEKADAVVIMTDKEEFFKLNLREMAKAMRKPVMVDASNLFEPQQAAKAGFTYIGIGRGFQILKPKKQKAAKK